MKLLFTQKMGEKIMTFKTALLITAFAFNAVIAAPQFANAQNPEGQAVNQDDVNEIKEKARLAQPEKLTGQFVAPAIECDSCFKDADGTIGTNTETPMTPTGDPVVTPTTTTKPTKK